MLGVDPRAARAAWTVFLLALVLAVIYHIRSVLLIFVIAILFAYLLAPAVNLVARWLPWWRSRIWALALVYVAFLLLLVGFGALIGGRVASEASNLAAGLPTLVANIEHRLEAPGPEWLAPVKESLLEQIRERARDFTTSVIPLVQTATTHLVGLLNSLVFIVLIPVLGFFFLKDGKELTAQLLGLLDSESRMMWEDIAQDVHVLLGQFIRALVIISAATLVIYGSFFVLIGLPYGALLATVAGVLEFIPIFGPLIAVVMILLVAALTGFGHILLILGFIGAYRLFQDYVMVPHLMGSGVALHPLLVIFGAFAGEAIAGIPGMFLAVPVLATLRVLFVRVQKARAARVSVTSAP